MNSSKAFQSQRSLSVTKIVFFVTDLFPDILIGGDHLLHEVPGDTVERPLLYQLHGLTALLHRRVAELKDTLHQTASTVQCS